MDLIDRLPPPRWLDQLAMNTAMPIPQKITEGSSSAEADPLAVRPISSVMPLGGAHPASAVDDEDSKDGIISDARRLQAKKKALLAMGEQVTGAPNVSMHV